MRVKNETKILRGKTETWPYEVMAPTNLVREKN